MHSLIEIEFIINWLIIDSISPNSILKPLILTWKSNLPINSIFPSLFHLHKSPVLYIFVLNFGLTKLIIDSGIGVNALEVFSSSFIYPFPTQTPVTTNSPAIPIGVGLLFESKIKSFIFESGFPIGIISEEDFGGF